MKREAARASDAEIEALQPIIADLVDLLDPHVIAKAYRAGRSTGATVRLLVIPEVDVDVIALARYKHPNRCIWHLRPRAPHPLTSPHAGHRCAQCEAWPTHHSLGCRTAQQRLAPSQ
jgi:hypothetical protein